MKQVSYCAVHNTYPEEGEPCWACANPFIQKAYEEGMKAAEQTRAASWQRKEVMNKIWLFLGIVMLVLSAIMLEKTGSGAWGGSVAGWLFGVIAQWQVVKAA